MKREVERQIRYLENKRKFEGILREKRLLKEYSDGDDLFDTITKAFTDIFKSLKLVAMDISNELRWIGEQFLYRNDPAKLEKARGDYKRKHDKLLKEWEPIVKDSMNAVKNADPFMTIALAPGLFLATKGITAAVSAGKNAAEVVAAEDWESIRAKMNKFQTGTDENPNAGSELGMGAIYDEMRKQNNILIRLNDLFVGREGAAAPATPATPPRGATTESVIRVTLREQDENSPEKITDPQEWLETFFELTGIDDEFTDVAAELLSGKIVLLKEMIPTIQSSTAVKKLVMTSDPKTFCKIIEQIVTENKLDASELEGLKKVVPKIEEQAKQVAASDKFRSQLAKADDKPVDELDQEEVLDQAMTVVFQQAKATFDEKYKKDLDKYTEVIKNNHEELDTDDQTLGLVKKRSDIEQSKEFVNLYEQYAKLYKEFMNLN